MRRGIVICMLLACSLLAAGCGQKKMPVSSGIDLSDVDYGKDFSLRDPDGNVRTMKDYRGKAVMLFFGFTQCPDVCPTALSRAAAVRQQLGKDVDKLQVIFVTVDPERDTPVVLKSYTKAFDPSFIGLSTDLDNTRKTADTFHVFYAKVKTGNSYTMDHSAISFLFDPSGKLRLAIRPAATVEEVTQDVQALLSNR